MILKDPKDGDFVRVELQLDNKPIEVRAGWIEFVNYDGSVLIQCRPSGQIQIEPNGQSVNGYFRVIEHNPENNRLRRDDGVQ
jgi:hypothetical protein